MILTMGIEVRACTDAPWGKDILKKCKKQSIYIMKHFGFSLGVGKLKPGNALICKISSIRALIDKH